MHVYCIHIYTCFTFLSFIHNTSDTSRQLPEIISCYAVIQNAMTLAKHKISSFFFPIITKVIFQTIEIQFNLFMNMSFNVSFRHVKQANM